MTYVPIYLPDGDQFSVEWYSSEGKFTGIERINEQWYRHDVGPVRDFGFVAPPVKRRKPRSR